MTFLYFIPKTISTEVMNVKELAEAGITWIGESDRFSSKYHVSGPGGQPGAIVSIGIDQRTAGADPTYDPARQTWRRHPSGKFWVGIETNNPPKPETLRRSSMIEGTPVTLLDGNEWIIPRCVSAMLRGMKSSTLPMLLDVNDAGDVVTRPLPQFEKIAEGCFEFFQRYIGQLDPPERDDEAGALYERQIDLAVSLLGLNYRIGCRLEAIGLMGLFSSDQWRLPLRAAIQADLIDREIDTYLNQHQPTKGNEDGTAERISGGIGTTPGLGHEPGAGGDARGAGASGSARGAGDAGAASAGGNDGGADRPAGEGRSQPPGSGDGGASAVANDRAGETAALLNE